MWGLGFGVLGFGVIGGEGPSSAVWWTWFGDWAKEWGHPNAFKAERREGGGPWLFPVEGLGFRVWEVFKGGAEVQAYRVQPQGIVKVPSSDLRTSETLRTPTHPSISGLRGLGFRV